MRPFLAERSTDEGLARPAGGHGGTMRFLVVLALLVIVVYLGTKVMRDRSR